MAENEIKSEKGETQKGNSLPDETDLTAEQIDTYLPVWQSWVLTGRKHLIKDLIQEPEEPFEIVMEIENVYQKMVAVLREQNG